MGELISIIIPVYNAEQYLGRCIQSVTMQSYRDLQIILVNDGSYDRSGMLCEQYAREDKRILVVHQENGGAAKARNTGLQFIRGKFVSFLDSDDYLDCDAVKILYNTVQETDADIVCMKKRHVAITELIPHNPADLNSISIMCSEDFFVGLHKRSQESGVCGKLFRSDLFTNYHFTEGRQNEDYLILATMLLECELKIACLPRYYGYYYFERDGSITRSGTGKANVDALENVSNIIEITKNFRPQLIPYARSYLTFQAATLLTLMGRNINQHPKELVNGCYKIIRENSDVFRYLPPIFFIRVLCHMAVYFPVAMTKLLIIFRDIIKC